MTCVFTPSRCHVNLGALRRNFQRLGDPSQLMPVIKSDAYGHGLVPCAKTLAACGARNFAVGMVDEGVELREHGLDQNIVPLLGCLSASDWQTAFRHRLLPLVGSFEDLRQADIAAREFPDSLPVAIKCNTGMSRLGFDLEEVSALMEMLASSRLRPSLLISHLSCADMPDQAIFTAAQIDIFNKFHEALRARYPDIIRSLGNSAASLAMPDAYFEIRRPGLALYGGDPFPARARGQKGSTLEWVMRISAPITHIRDLRAGESISYGRMFKTDRPMRVAVVAAGYATGINRGLSNKIDFIVNGRRARQLGRICMGMLMLDVTHVTNVSAGDNAWLLGSPDPGGERAVNADEIATMLDTIPYEILCSLGSLNPRVYEDN